MAGKGDIGLEVEKEFDGNTYKGWVKHISVAPIASNSSFHHTVFQRASFVLAGLHGKFADPHIHSDSVHIQVTKYFKKEDLYHVKYEDDDEEDIDAEE